MRKNFCISLLCLQQLQKNGNSKKKFKKVRSSQKIMIYYSDNCVEKGEFSEILSQKPFFSMFLNWKKVMLKKDK